MSATFPLDRPVADAYAELRDKMPPDPASLLFDILDLHEPVDRGSGVQCAGCDLAGVAFVWHRCKTIRLIADRLSVRLDHLA